MQKAPAAFRTISEVAELLETPAHVLRFWESRFTQVKPVKRAGGRRYYRPADLALLSGIKHLLHNDGLTIRGVQKILNDQGVRHVAAMADPALLAANEGAAPSVPATAEPDAADPADASAPAQPLQDTPDQADSPEAHVIALQPGMPISPDPGAPPAPEPAPATTAPTPEPEADAMPAPPSPEASPEDAALTDAAPGMTALAARLRALDPDGLAVDRAALAALRARLVALHARRSEALVAGRI
jgi:DNA-binding transcriptional MerR regulator